MPGAALRIEADLEWLGLSFDPVVYVQSARFSEYDAALAELTERGLVYPCDCSRRELAAVTRAPHAGDELRYPGLCRDKDPQRAFKREPALRLRVPAPSRVQFVDQLTGTTISSQVDRDVGDFVLRRGDGLYAYQLAVAVDDSAMRISHVVRGRDLLGSTARQLLLLQLLERPAPHYYLHVPLVVMPDGERLAKRLRSVTVRSVREARVAPEQLVGLLAHGLGLTASDAACGADSLTLAPESAHARLRHASFEVPSWLLQLLELPSAR